MNELRSDNGINFVSTERKFKAAVKSYYIKQIECSPLHKVVKWSFNPPDGAHHGWIRERLIWMVKRIFLSVMRQQSLDDGLQTIMCEVKAILNSHPLTIVSDDPNDLELLTPNHLRQLKVQLVLPPASFRKQDLYTRRHVQCIADLLWTR